MPTIDRGSRTPAIVLALIALGLTAAPMSVPANCEEAELPALLDPVPDRYRVRLQALERALRSEREAHPELFRPVESGIRAQFVILPESYRWPRNGTIAVAFLGGSELLRARIEAAAREWLQENETTLALSFRDSRGDFREWSRSDVLYRAHIRIAFDLDGYWSLVGNASRVRGVADPHEASMSLGGFTEDLPDGWDTIVMHEFGHALGFEHEHQHPGARCRAEMKWHPDNQYQVTTDSYGTLVPDSHDRSPGVLLHFGGPPNNWSQQEIEQNIEAVEPSSVLTSEFDRESVMKYYFPRWLFLDPQTSDCFNEPNHFLSDGDRMGMRCFYSADPPEDCPGEADETLGMLWEEPDKFEKLMRGLRNAIPPPLFETLRDFELAMQEISTPR